MVSLAALQKLCTLATYVSQYRTNQGNEQKNVKDCETNDARNKKRFEAWDQSEIFLDSKHENLFCNANGTPNYWILNALCI